MHHASSQSAIAASGCHEKECCRKPVKKSSASESPSESQPLKISNEGELKVCTLLAKQTVAFTVSPKSESPVEVLATLPTTLATAFTYAGQLPSPQSIEPQNRGGTYLRCCVLLI